MRKIYSLFIPILISIMCVTTLTSCGKIKEIDEQKLSERLLDSDVFSENLSEIDRHSAERLYFLNPNDYRDMVIYTGTEATCDEIVIINTANVSKVQDRLKTHLELQKKNYSSYRPTESAKIENAVLEVYKETVVLVVSGNSGSVKKIYEDYLRKK